MTKELIGLSCVCVGMGEGGTISMLGRVSLVDRLGKTLYDTYVKPTSKVESYREATTGLDATHFNEALSFETAQRDVAVWIKDKIVVGHKLWLNFQVLGISHPAIDTRDVGLYFPFRRALSTPNGVIGLQTLMWHLMKRKIRKDFIDSLEDARAAMDLYRSESKNWEGEHKAGQWPCALPPQAFNRHYT
ncbi:hypothetical protein FS837_000440 [Tulasnella sp. UAMH 9824]|nr:hypothetical protein FS837_000440 [Tulasnella sp. UAMH 9824]